MSLDNVEAMLTTHVDDLALTAPRKWLDEHYNKFVNKFKKVSRQSLPLRSLRTHPPPDKRWFLN